MNRLERVVVASIYIDNLAAVRREPAGAKIVGQGGRIDVAGVERQAQAADGDRQVAQQGGFERPQRLRGGVEGQHEGEVRGDLAQGGAHLVQRLRPR